MSDVQALGQIERDTERLLTYVKTGRNRETSRLERVRMKQTDRKRTNVCACMCVCVRERGRQREERENERQKCTQIA